MESPVDCSQVEGSVGDLDSPADVTAESPVGQVRSPIGAGRVPWWQVERKTHWGR